MKILTSLMAGTYFLLATLTTRAQPDTAKMTQYALSYADSLIKTDSFQNWSAYADLAIPSVIKY